MNLLWIACILQIYFQFNHLGVRISVNAKGNELDNEAKMLSQGGGEMINQGHYIGSDAVITLSSLSDESKTVKEDIVFGIVTSAELLEVRIDFLQLWWLPGTTGCVYFDETMISGAMRLKLPRGLEVCFTPDAYLSRPW